MSLKGVQAALDVVRVINQGVQNLDTICKMNAGTPKGVQDEKLRAAVVSASAALQDEIEAILTPAS